MVRVISVCLLIAVTLLVPIAIYVNIVAPALGIEITRRPIAEVMAEMAGLLKFLAFAVPINAAVCEITGLNRAIRRWYRGG